LHPKIRIYVGDAPDGPLSNPPSEISNNLYSGLGTGIGGTLLANIGPGKGRRLSIDRVLTIHEEGDEAEGEEVHLYSPGEFALDPVNRVLKIFVKRTCFGGYAVVMEPDAEKAWEEMTKEMATGGRMFPFRYNVNHVPKAIYLGDGKAILFDLDSDGSGEGMKREDAKTEEGAPPYQGANPGRGRRLVDTNQLIGVLGVTRPICLTIYREALAAQPKHRTMSTFDLDKALEIHEARRRKGIRVEKPNTMSFSRPDKDGQFYPPVSRSVVYGIKDIVLTKEARELGITEERMGLFAQSMPRMDPKGVGRIRGSDFLDHVGELAASLKKTGG
jgi:hypothetical protein